MAPEGRPELLALLADVKENPDNLTPWLVLCDWLEENGDEADRARSEYCRLCFDKLGKKTYASDWEKGERRRELYRRYHETWLGPIEKLKPQIQKGLLVLDSHDLSAHVPELQGHREAWAWVGTLRVWMTTAELLRLDPWLVEGLNRLEMTRDLGGEEQVERFAGWSALRRVPRLSLQVHALTPGKARSLARSPFLANVRELLLFLYTQGTAPAARRRKDREEAVRTLEERFGPALKIARG